MAKVGRSVIQSSLAHFGQLAISLGLVVAVSRILSPEAVGVFLMAYVAVLIVLPLHEFQIQSFVIQRQQIDKPSLRAVSFAAWASSLVALAVCLVAAALFKLAYPDGAIAECLLIACLGFLIRPFSVPAAAVLARNMRYGVLSAIKLWAAVGRAVATLGLLAAGFGPEALSWGLVAESVVGLAALRHVHRENRLIAPSPRGSREVFAFCAPYSGAHLVITLSTALTPLLIGSFQGLAMAAFFNRARTVTQFFRSSVEGAIQPIVLSEFTKVRHDKAELQRVYLRATSLLTGLAWPSLAWLGFSAGPLTLTVFGEEWATVAPLATLLALGGLLYSTTAWSAQLHAAFGQSKLLLLRDGLLQLPLLLILFFTAHISTLAVAGGMVAAAVLSLAVNLMLVRRHFDISITQAIACLNKSWWVAAMTGGIPYALSVWIEEGLSAPQALALMAASAAIIWPFALWLTRHPLLDEAKLQWASLRGAERPLA